MTRWTPEGSVIKVPFPPWIEGGFLRIFLSAVFGVLAAKAFSLTRDAKAGAKALDTFAGSFWFETAVGDD